MRALCGSITTAGALVGLGLTALGYGIRFQAALTTNQQDGQLPGIASMAVILIVLLLATLIGISFLGLAFHHERRHRESLHQAGEHHRTLGGR